MPIWNSQTKRNLDRLLYKTMFFVKKGGATPWRIKGVQLGARPLFSAKFDIF